MIENMSEIYMTGIKRNDCLYESELLACCQSASERMLGGISKVFSLAKSHANGGYLCNIVYAIISSMNQN